MSFYLSDLTFSRVSSFWTYTHCAFQVDAKYRDYQYPLYKHDGETTTNNFHPLWFFLDLFVPQTGKFPHPDTTISFTELYVLFKNSTSARVLVADFWRIYSIRNIYESLNSSYDRILGFCIGSFALFYHVVIFGRSKVCLKQLS